MANLHTVARSRSEVVRVADMALFRIALVLSFDVARLAVLSTGCNKQRRHHVCRYQFARLHTYTQHSSALSDKSNHIKLFYSAPKS